MSGPVIISVNPFKNMPYFTNREVDVYQGAVSSCKAIFVHFLVAEHAVLIYP